MLTDDYQKLLSGAQLSWEEERAIIDSIANTSPKSLPGLCLFLANQKRQLRAELTGAREVGSAAQSALAQLTAPPWYPADVLRVRLDGRLEVAVNGRRQVVAAAPELDLATLRPGAEVFLSRDENAAIALGDGDQRVGVIGVVAEAEGERVVLRGVADEEIVATCAASLAATLRAGDRVLYRRESHCVIEQLPARETSPFLLERPPAVTFADVGGLDDVIADIQRDLDLHLRHPERVRAYRLRLLRGITLVGPAGTGKTLLASAMANYLDAAGTTRFLYVKPGALRGSWYGESEARIRELFRVARRAPGLCVCFFDEADNFGARGAGIGQDIDGRVLASFLTEVDGLETAGRLLLVAATNRLDLCDEALVRPGRFGDRIYTIGRPGREAARQIFAQYLRPDLPYWPRGDGPAEAATLIDAAVAYLYAPQGGAGMLGTVTLTNGERHEVAAPAVMSGALIASAVERAKHAAAARHTETDGGLTIEDLLAALDQALAAEVDKLRAPHAARRLLDFPGAEEIVRVEIPVRRRPRRHRYLRAV